MIELTKGDKDNLEGRVIVYSRFVGDKDFANLTNHLPKGTIFAIYAATNRADFVSNP